jgi:hypothetical protein
MCQCDRWFRLKLIRVVELGLRGKATWTSVQATRELCVDLDNLIELAKQGRAPIRALSLIEPAREDLQAYLDEIERTSSARPAWSWSLLKAKKELWYCGETTMGVLLILVVISISANAAPAQDAAPKIGNRPLYQVKPKALEGCKLVGTIKGAKLWDGDCISSQLRGTTPAVETQSLPERFRPEAIDRRKTERISLPRDERPSLSCQALAGGFRAFSLSHAPALAGPNSVEVLDSVDVLAVRTPPSYWYRNMHRCQTLKPSTSS